MILILSLGVAALVLGLALWTIAARRTLAAVVGFIAYGLLLTLAWVQLRGVDVALTEGAIGGGLTGALLIGAASRLGPADAAVEGERPLWPMRLLAGATAAAVAGGVAVAFLALPEQPPTLAFAVAASLPSIGVGNPITGVLLAFRSMDTLLEAVVLLFALIGVWSLAPDRLWGGPPGERNQPDPHGILVYAARVLPPIGVVVGLYVFWTGADAPGGKFQGATIVAAMASLVIMAGIADAPPISRAWVRAVLGLGALVFIAIGLAGVLTAGAFLAYPAGWAKPLIVVIEAALMPMLTLTLGLLLAGPPARAPS